MLYLLRFKVCGGVSYFGKAKTKFATGSTITKVNIEHLEKVARKFLRNVFTLAIVSVATVELMIGIL